MSARHCSVASACDSSSCSSSSFVMKDLSENGCLKEPITEHQLRTQFSTSGLSRIGFDFARAMSIPAIAISLACGARAADKASRINQQNPHWTERQS